MGANMAFTYGFGILLADQWSKRAIQLHGANGDRGWGTIVRFRLTLHREKAFELTGTRTAFVIAWILAVICGVFLNRAGAWFQGDQSLAGLGLALGGAASNLFDILRYRSVINYIDLGWWPVFNLADVAILAGLALALLG